MTPGAGYPAQHPNAVEPAAPRALGRRRSLLFPALEQPHASERMEHQRPLEVAFVNLMPDAAFLDTENQFMGLLADAAEIVPQRVHRYSIAGVPRGPEVRRILAESYEDANVVMATRVDALIITGTEPLQPSLEEEDYWPTLSSLIRWAERTVPSVILSCLAAHAAVKLFDGIERTRLARKLSGAYRMSPSDRSALTEGLAPTTWFPHSRSNDVPKSELVGRGYFSVLDSGERWTAVETTRGVGWFLLYQGHPEYAPNSLLREYRRDVRRYLAGERSSYPVVPENYLDQEATQLLEEFRLLPATRRRVPEAIEAFPTRALEDHIVPSWSAAAGRLYGNWIRVAVVRRQAADERVVEVRGEPVKVRREDAARRRTDRARREPVSAEKVPARDA